MELSSDRQSRTYCPACASKKLSIAFDRQSWARQVADKRDSRPTFAGIMAADPALAFEHMLRCDVCGTLFTDHIPTIPALNGFYQAVYANDGYLNKLERKLALEKRRVFALKWLTSGRRFLDIGCNIGCAVEAARWNGFAATGIDLSEYAMQIARERFSKNRFLQGTIDVLDAGSVFDLVYCSEVVEHVSDPPGFFRSLSGTVASGGVLMLTTPDAGHFSVRNNQIDWDSVKPPEHITLFTKAGLKYALTPYFKSIWFLPNRKPGIQLIARRG